MMQTIIYAIASVIIVSLISVVGALPFILKKNVSQGILVFLLSVSVGVLLSTVFLDFLPEVFEAGHADGGHSLSAPLYILFGFIVMFVIEKFVHWHHSKKCENGDCGHSHAYSVAPLNLIGDGIHNFIDGLVIAGAYTVSITVGIAATISIIFHEIPQEIADFGVLLYSGMQKKRAIIFNLLSGLTALVGTIIGLFLIHSIEGFNQIVIPFAAGNFIYIAASNLVPQLHRKCSVWEDVMHVSAIILGVAIVVAVTVLGPAHVH
jgi:zinc and cadmium transporter